VNARRAAAVAAITVGTLAATSRDVRAAAAVTPAASGAAWTATALARLRADLDETLARAITLRGAHVGVDVVETATGTVLYARAAGDAFQPASTMKLLVGSVALDKLGPAYRFRTEARLRGDALVVAASGDPLFAHDDLASLALALRARVPSDVALDASHFDDERYPAGWTWDDFSFDYAAPLSAATIDENVRSVAVLAGARVGDGVRLQVGDATLAPPYRCTTGGFVSVATTAAADATSTIDTRTRGIGCTEIDGHLGLGKRDAVDVAVADPEAAYLDAVRRALGDAARPFAAVASPAPDASPQAPAPLGDGTSIAPGPAFWTHDSAALGTFLGPRFWVPSDNLVGELLLKEVGFATGGRPGTTAKGAAYEKVWLRSIGVDPATLSIADGCGMSQYDRLTPRALVAILQHDWQGPYRQIVLDSLPIGGVRGTIEGIAGTPAQGRVFAKTGSMMHVRGLAGYLATVRHGAVTFAFNVDDWNGDYPSLAAVRAAVLARIVAD